MCIKLLGIWFSIFGKSTKTPANVSAVDAAQTVVQDTSSVVAISTGNVDTETLLGRLPDIPHVATAIGVIVRSLRPRS